MPLTEFFQYFIASIIVYSGLVFGYVLKSYTGDEVKQGEKYLVLMQNAVLAFIVFFIFEFYNANIILTILAAMSVFIVPFYLKRLRSVLLSYLFLAIIFFLSFKNKNLFVVESSLMFLYGLPTGSLVKEKKKGFIFGLSFVVLVLILYFVFHLPL